MESVRTDSLQHARSSIRGKQSSCEVTDRPQVLQMDSAFAKWSRRIEAATHAKSQ
jgi:hypothetical protein